MLTLYPEEWTWLAEYRRVLSERHSDGVLRMVIFGSKARGDGREDSDLDVLLVVRDEAADLKRPLRRIGYDLAAATLVVPSIMAYTQTEWGRLKALRSSFRAAIERDGVAVL